MKAVLFCKLESVKLLLEAKANPLVQTVEGDNIFTQAEKM
jgi:hypothetical protein